MTVGTTREHACRELMTASESRRVSRMVEKATGHPCPCKPGECCMLLDDHEADCPPDGD